jgi:choline dehydrogenase
MISRKHSLPLLRVSKPLATFNMLLALMVPLVPFTPPTQPSMYTLTQFSFTNLFSPALFPRFNSLPEVVGSWTSTLANMGIHTSSDPSDGDASGAFITTLTINPTNWTRSYSKSAYIDPYYRPNLHILTDATVTKIAFDGTKATSVQYGDGKSIGVKKEVVLSAGPVGSPATLMRSGVGPKDVLDGAGVSTVVELPGVGQHLQDHLASQVVFDTTTETAGSVHSNADDPRANVSETDSIRELAADPSSSRPPSSFHMSILQLPISIQAS